MRRAALFPFIIVFLLLMSGCGSQSSVTSNTTNFGPIKAALVSLTVTDSPPAGVTVLFFQLSISAATLTPSSVGGVSLLPSNNGISEPIPVNVTQLQTDSAFLGTGPVPPGTYTGLSVTFSESSQLTIYNGSGAAIGSCANNSVCQLTPVPAPLTLAFPSAGSSSTAPFPTDLSLNSPVAFQLDIHLDTVIQPDLTVNLGATNGVTLSELPTPPSGAPVSALGHMIGTIQAVSSTASPNEFVLQTGDGGNFTIDVGSNTTYSDFPSSACSTETFPCLAPQQIVKVELSLQTGGTLLASEVKYLQPAGRMVVEGDIIRLSVSEAGTLIDIVLQQGPPTPTPDTLPYGQRATVTVPATGVTYAVDSGSFTIPNGLSFAGASDLFVGQQVLVVAVPGSLTTTSASGSSTPWAGPAATTFTASSITLEPSQITGSVTEIIAGGFFTLSTYPDYFLPTYQSSPISWYPASVAVTVQTNSETAFTNFTPDSISGLAVNDVVSVEGWVFQYNGVTCLTIPYCFDVASMAAETVVGRPGPTPLF
jgi:hypothetical protein